MAIKGDPRFAECSNLAKTAEKLKIEAEKAKISVGLKKLL